MKDWLPIDKFNFEDKNMIRFHVDTRDFHIIGNETIAEDVAAVLPDRDDFKMTVEEIKKALISWKEQSGGESEWRHFDLSGDVPPKAQQFWLFKYLRFWKNESGDWFMYSERAEGDYNFFPKEFLSRKAVDKMYEESEEEQKRPPREFSPYVPRIGGEDSYLQVEETYWTTQPTLTKGPQLVRKEPKISNNALCTCGSGKKYKKCCKFATAQ